MTTGAGTLRRGDRVTYGAITSKTTTVNTYDTVMSLPVAGFKTTAFQFTGATQNLLVKVDGSIDGGTTFPYLAENDVAVTAAATVAKVYITGNNANLVPFTHIRVQVKPANANNHGTLTGQYCSGSY
jgi:hypothetical protein